MDIEIKNEPAWIHYGILALTPPAQAFYFQYFPDKSFVLNILKSTPCGINNLAQDRGRGTHPQPETPMPATITSIREEAHDLLTQLGVSASAYTSGSLTAHTPITGEELARIPTTSPEAAASALIAAHKAFEAWRNVPAPKRGELVRLLGEELRANLEPLGRLVTLEAGKILSEGLGEVQEMIDICTFGAGLSRQLAGLTIASERANHRMMETWHPLGVTGIISAFNFPVAVWSWNAALALVCGNSIVWKPSERSEERRVGKECW